MRRSLHVATLVLACAALVPACLLDGSSIDDGTGGSAGGTLPTGGGGAGGAPTGGGGSGGTPTGGMGGAGGTGGTGGTGGVMSPCGDGAVDAGEGCDDANTASGDGCDALCQVEAGFVCNGEPSVCVPTCGNGQINDNEQCDDGNLTAGDGCGDTCQIEAGWGCTQPMGNMGVSVCTSVCGDGLIVGAEVCDDGDMDDTDGCKADCLGVNDGWDCDGMTGGADSCATICGDGIVIGDECEDGNPVPASGDGCSAECQVEHTCGNGIVEATEACDGGAGCKADCTLVDPASVCGMAPLIAPLAADIDPVSGVRISYYQSDTSIVTVPLVSVTVPAQICDSSPVFPNLHRYTTGPRGSIVTVEALDKLANNSTTFDKTVVWVYRDCPNRADYEGCSLDGGKGGRALFTTGYLPPKSTIYVVLAGEAGLDKGPYRLQVTEQPVNLFYHESFGPETNAGEYPLPASLTADPVADGGWATCVAGVGNDCFAVDLDSHTSGALGFTAAGTDAPTVAAISTPMAPLAGLQQAFGQFTHVYKPSATANDSAEAAAFDGGSKGASVPFNDTSSSGRRILAMPKSNSAHLRFTFDDGSSMSAGTLFIDDIYIYGY